MMATLVLNIRRAVTGLALICLQNALAHAESIAPNSDTRERWRVDYADIGYPNVGFSPYIKGWINGYLTPADYPDGAAILPPPPVEDSAAWKADVEIFTSFANCAIRPGAGWRWRMPICPSMPSVGLSPTRWARRFRASTRRIPIFC